MNNLHSNLIINKFIKQIPLHLSTKYLGIAPWKRLTCSNNTKQKREQHNSHLQLLWSVLKSNKSLKNKLLIYKLIIILILTHDFQLCGPAKLV